MDYEKLDSGIRDIVKLLNEAGYRTTDSGDGKSKFGTDEEGCAMPFPHVAVRFDFLKDVRDANHALLRTNELAELLGSDWQVEISYLTGEDYFIVFCSKVDEMEEYWRSEGYIK